MTNAVAVILAGGRGQRLGDVSKAGLRLPNGTTYLEAIAATARAADVDICIAVIAEPHRAAVAAIAATASIDALIVNPDPTAGMISSLAAGIRAIEGSPADVALVWPVDHPRVAPATIRQLLDVASPQRIVVPTHLGRGGHPTAFGAATWGELRHAALASGLTARDVVHRDPTRLVRIDVDDSAVIRDVDHPADIEVWQ